jgi:acetyl esterase/lipase
MSIQADVTKVILRIHFWRLLRQPYQKQRISQESFNRLSARIPKGTLFRPDIANGVSVEWVSSSESSLDHTILYFHGGAYFAGSITTHRDFAAHLVKATGFRVLLVDYRLAPEHPFPAAVEDAYAVYHWLLNQGFTSTKIIITGDSAGGGLTLAALLKLRDVGDPLPAGAVCISPWTDLAMTGESMMRNANIELMCKPDFMKESACWYAAGYDAKNPLISPLYADLTGLPPAMVHVGADETLLDDSVRLAERAREASWPVDLHVWPGMFHIFPLVSYIPEAKRSLMMISDFVYNCIDGNSNR